MRYYGYYRCSTLTQVKDGYGLDTQKDGIEEWAKKNNVEITEYFHDDGVSGTSLERDGLTQLLATLEKDDRVVVLNTSRLWRDESAKVLVHHTIKKAGADIISIEQPNYTIYSVEPTDFLFNGLMELLDQYSRLEINMKLCKGRTTKAKKGTKSCGTAPIGYRWNKDAETEIDEANSMIVTDIFHSYVNMRSLAKVADYCKSKGYKTTQGNDFSKQSLKNILTNDYYIGIVRFGGKEYQGNQPTFIEADLFNDVQSILKRTA